MQPVLLESFLSTAELASISELWRQPIWSFGWQANSAFNKNHFWHAHLCGGTRDAREDCSVELSQSSELAWLYKIWTRLTSASLGGKTLSRVYANAHTYGLDGMIHRDCSAEDNGKTIVIYMHEHWSTSWGGELVFYSSDSKKIISSIIPAPGSAVIFDGSIPHLAKSPGRECPGLRISLVFKTFN